MHKNLLALLLFLVHSLTTFSQSICPVFPKNNFVTNKNTITFSWNIINTTDSFNFQISNSENFSNLLIDTIIIGSTFTIDTFFTAATYFWKVKRTDATHYDTTISFTIFSPNSISSIALWLDADTGIVFESGKVKEWYDLSPNNNNLYQNDTSLQPLWTDSLINNKPCVSFTGNLDYLNYSDTIDTLGGTLFLIYKNTDSIGSYLIGYSEYASGGGLYTDEDNSRFWFNGNRNCNVNYDNNNNFALISVKQDTTQYGNFWQSFYARIKYNQYIGDSISTYGYNFAMNWLGTTNWYGGKKHCEGFLPELIYYYEPLNDSLYSLNEQYLRWKYAPPVNLGHDIYIPYGFCDTVLDAGSRFTSFLWSTGDTTQTITVNQPGQYFVTVTDIFGFQSTDSIVIRYPSPTQLNDTVICFGDTLTWYANMDTTYQYNWSTGNTTDEIKIWQQGYYYLQIIDSSGCKFFSDTIFVKVDSFPVLATLGNDTSLCSGTNIFLTNGNNGATNYYWSTGDTLQYITVINPGTYAVTVIDTTGCIANDTIQIAIHGQAPVPDFTWQAICLGDTTLITDLSYATDNSNIISWQWQLPDTLLTTQNIAYIFSDTGNFPVTLSIVTDSNCSNTIQKQIIIHPLPEADFSTTQLCSDIPIELSENVSCPDSIISYFWDFDDGNFAATANPVHQYSQSGTYDVLLVVESSAGCRDSVSVSLEIKQSPVVDFSHTILCSGKTAIFNDQSTVSPIFPIISWDWDFGDGSDAENSNPTHIFADTGIYFVSLTVQSLNGCTQTKTDTVNVFPSPQAGFFTGILCSGTKNQFTDTSVIVNDSITNRTWYVNNIQQSTEQNPLFYFDSSGTYSIMLITQSQNNCLDTTINYYYVFSSPSADFSFYPEIGTPAYYLSFTADSNLNYFWDFGDTFTSTEQHPTHLYTDSGTFTVTLITTNDNGCQDTAKKTIMVVLPTYDVAIIDYDVIQTNNYLTFSCRFLNAGSLPLDSINLILQIQNAPYFMEKWIGHILPGEIVSYSFSMYYKITDFVPEISCVELHIPGQTDLTPENNLKCNTTSDQFIFYTLYPNPANTSLYLEFNNSRTQTVNFRIVSELGKIILSDKQENLTKGFQRIEINISSLESGIYTILIYTDIDKEEKQFMVY